jgi:molybdopterin-dependent oxidoreductase alpha subunit
MADLSRVTLAVLSGGAGTRMGLPKAWLQLNNRPILQHLHQSLAWPGPTLLVTVPARRQPPGYELFQSEVVDPVEQGPLRGILTALEHSTTSQTIIIPLDMPYLRIQHLQWFANSLEENSELLGLISQRSIDGKLQIEPLPLAARPTAKKIIAEQLQSPDHSLHALSHHPRFALKPAPSNWPPQIWTNLNYPTDLPNFDNQLSPDNNQTPPAQNIAPVFVMHQHEHDENNAPDQADTERPTDPEAHLATGVPGAQSPLETDGAHETKRHHVAAGFFSIYETAKFGLKEMGAKRTLHTLLKINQKDGFDCPSCAWPDPDDKRKIAEFCENGAKAVASEATKKKLTPEHFADLSISHMLQQSDYWLEQQGRITHPMHRKKGSDHYEPISWDAAFELIATEIRSLPTPDHAIFYTSGRASNEAAFLYGLFARQLGTNNLPDCSNMCHESSGAGLSKVIGIGKATIKHEDFALADSIFIIGQNPGTCHPRMLTELQKAVRNGCKLVSINPLFETGLRRFKNPQEPIQMLGPGTEIACLSLPIRINGDIALLKGIMKEMLEEDERTNGKVLAHDFIEHHTEGFEAFAKDLREEPWEKILENSGIPRDQIHEAAQIAIQSERMICSWAMGITQHKSGVANVQTIANFALLRGQIGRRGAGLCPMRGHSNVQGDRTVGIWEKMSDEFMKALGKKFNFSPPEKHGFDAVRSIEAMHNGKAKVFIALGGNFLSATPDTNYTSEALQRCTLTVQISTKLNRSHLITGEQALILPCLGRTELDFQKAGQQILSVEDTTGVVHLSRGVLPPASDQLRSEPAIIAGIAKTTLKEKTTVNWQALTDNYDLIRDHIEHVVPGFTQYNTRVRQPGGFYLPNPPRQGKFNTPSSRAHFTIHPIPQHDLSDGKLLLTTIRSHDQFNTTIYSENDRYRGISKGRRVVFLNVADIERLGLQKDQWVDLISHYESEIRRAERFKVVPYEIPLGCAAAYFPETNVLVPVRNTADQSNQPASKSIVISIEAANPNINVGLV